MHACPALLCWSRAERAELQDAYAAEAGRAEQQTLRRVYEALDWAAVGLAPPPRKAEWLWAVGMVLSRAFSAAGVVRLLPFVDLLNHSPDAGEISIQSDEASGGGVVAWSKSAGSGGIRSGAAVEW